MLRWREEKAIEIQERWTEYMLKAIYGKFAKEIDLIEMAGVLEGR